MVEAFGDKVPEMYEIQALCTDPDAQGHGYASALVEYVLKQVSFFPLLLFFRRCTELTFLKGDAERRDVWLLTTDSYGFYERFGFAVVRSGIIAVDNPAWDGEPITLHIVIRVPILYSPHCSDTISRCIDLLGRLLEDLQGSGDVLHLNGCRKYVFCRRTNLVNTYVFLRLMDETGVDHRPASKIFKGLYRGVSEGRALRKLS